MKERTTFRFAPIGVNKLGIAVFERATKTITVEAFAGMNEETGKPRFRTCITLVRSTSSTKTER
jgi:hypothetical protein